MAKNIIELLMGRKPDKYVTNEAGDTTGFEYSGTVPGGVPGLIGEMFGRGSQEPEFQGPPVPPDYQYTPPVNEKPSDNPLNPLNQKVNEVSNMENTNNYNQVEQTDSSSYDKMVKDLGERWGQDSSSLEDIMNRIAYHESAGTMNPAIQQYGGGPGRGLFQFELGAEGGGMTGRNRLARWFEEQGQETPAWLNQEGMDKSGFDASKLTDEQQKMLFLANTRYHPSATLKGIDSKNLGERFWAPFHWAGDASKRAGHLASFDESMGAFDLNNMPNTEELAFNY
tara:strand:+ start:765 stop:1610 length:846 start_codon:yes stop_codon:yes gene_type:complete